MCPESKINKILSIYLCLRLSTMFYLLCMMKEYENLQYKQTFKE